MLNAEFRMQNSESATSAMTRRPLWRRTLVLSAFGILHSALLLSLVGCGARAKAQTLPDGPPLAVPTAPAHEIVIEQIAEAPPPQPEPVPEPVAATPNPNAIKVQTKPSAPKPEPPANQPAVAPPAAPETPVVRASPAAAAGDETKARTLIARATNDLEKRVDFQRLSDEGKAQYNQSKRFRDQADQALKERNFLLAVTLADKAATLAAELVR
jgi:outer membrane biosynthesis protein TonB